MKTLLIFLLLLYSASANTTVFKCVDNNGSITYSDIKCEKPASQIIGSKKPNLPISQTKNKLEKMEISINSVWVQIVKGASYYFFHIVFSTYLLMSTLCYIAYSRDKKSARAKHRRTPERTLHIYEFLGGWPGGFIAQRTLRHKNRKLSYQLSFWLIASLHMVGWLDYLVLNQFFFHRIISLVNSSTQQI